MGKISVRIAIFSWLLLSSIFCIGQDSISAISPKISTSYINTVISRTNDLGQKLEKKADKALEKLSRQESIMKRKLLKIDSLAANTIFTSAGNKYKELESRINDSKLKQYLPRLDSVATSLKFLQDNPQILSTAKAAKEKLTAAVSKVKGLENQFQKAEEIKKFLRERKQFLKEQVSKFGFAKQFKKINKQVYYYAAQINEYKEILNDPKKIEKKALELLSKTKFFRDFMRKNSMLASLFRMPGDPNDPTSQANLAGLQTRLQVGNLIQQQVAAGGPNANNSFSKIYKRGRNN